jgi:uncharacterized membrane protein (UPF0136 family)
MFQWPVLLLYIYGIVLILGGTMGYIKAKSVPSVVAGVICGCIALFLGYNYTWHYAPYAALFLSVFLIIVMGRRYLRTRKPMPAMPVIILSIIVAVVQIYILLAVGPGSDPL